MKLNLSGVQSSLWTASLNPSAETVSPQTPLQYLNNLLLELANERAKELGVRVDTRPDPYLRRDTLTKDLVTQSFLGDFNSDSSLRRQIRGLYAYYCHSKTVRLYTAKEEFYGFTLYRYP